jgi:hypothetical protein
MFSEETKTVVYIGVGLFLVASLLTFIMIFIDIRNDFAGVRNEEIATANNLKAFRQFEKFNNSIVPSEEVIAMVTKYYDEGVDIYLRHNGTLINRDTIVTNPEYKDPFWLEDPSRIGLEEEYKAVLVYDFTDVTTITDFDTNPKGYHSDVTGVVFIQN